MIRRVVRSLRQYVGLPDRLAAELKATERKIETAVKANADRAQKTTAKVDELQSDIRALQAEVRERLLQYHYLLGRLEHLVEGGPVHLQTGSPVPLALSGGKGRSSPRPKSTDERQRDALTRPVPAFTADDWLVLDACSSCGDPDRTVVCEWNKYVMLDSAPDEEARRYEYAVCHECGVLYATKRPVGRRIRHLLSNFVEATGKAAGARELTNPLLNPYPLTDADRQQLRRLLAPGIFVSDHVGMRPEDHLEGLLKDRLENSVHLEILGSLVPMRSPRVLEIRPRTGAILDGLRRLYGAEVYAMPIWESQQFLIKELYKIDSASLIDFDHFTIPYEGKFDLIVCNHIFTHILRPREFFETIRSALVAGGHLYLYNDPDDDEYVNRTQSIFAALNPLHMQAFDQRSLVRALGANGFETRFIRRSRNLTHMCLARAGSDRWEHMSVDEKHQRIQAHRRARDRAILQLPERARARFASEWEAVVERAVAAGIAGFDEKGQLRLYGDRVARPTTG